MSEACFHNLFLAIRQKRIEELFEDKPFFGGVLCSAVGGVAALAKRTDPRAASDGLALWLRRLRIV